MDEYDGDGVVSRWCRTVSGREHAWRWMRTLREREDRPGKSACRQPGIMVCAECLEQRLQDCGSHDPEVCRPCAKRYKREVRAVAADQLLSAEDGTLWFVTLTAPGSVAAGDGESVIGDAVARWNGCVAEMWNRFSEELKRSMPGFAGLAYAKVAEEQRRGVLHLHVVIRTRRPVALSRTQIRRIQEIAVRVGFGCQMDFARVGPSRADRERVASYLVKDVARPPLWVGEQRAGVRRRRMRVFTTSRNWGTTIALVRARARAWFQDKVLRRHAQPSVPTCPAPGPDAPPPG